LNIPGLLPKVLKDSSRSLFGMPTIAATVATVQALPAPVMFLDTCVLLDIIRAPLRNAASAVEAASQLLTGTQHAPPSV